MLNHILGNLNQTITLSGSDVQDKFGKTSYSSGTDYLCRFQKVTKNIVTAQNELTPISAIVFLGPDTVVDIGYKAIFGTSDYKVMSVEPMIDRYGRTRHYELSLQEWNL